MPRRRRGWGKGARMAYGLSTGAQQFFAQMMRDMAAQRTAAAIAEREEARDMRTLARQETLAEQTRQAQTRAWLVGKFGDVAKGDLTPEAFAAMAGAGGFEDLGQMAEGLRPSPRRRMEGALGPRISGAKSPEEVPSDLDIASIARGLDVGPEFPGLDPQFTEGMAPASGTFAGLDPVVAEFGQRAASRAHDLRQPQRDLDAALAALPSHLQPFANMIKGGAMGKISPGDMQSPEDREASEIRVRQAGVAPKSAQYEQIETVDEAGNPMIKFLTPEEVRQMGGVRPYTKATKDSGTSALYSTERAIRTIQSVDELSQKVNEWTVGYGSLLKNVPRTEALAFKAELDTLKANIAFNELTEMREASKTGGALGPVSDFEGRLLASSLGAVDQAQDVSQMLEQLAKIRGSVERWNAAKQKHAGQSDQDLNRDSTAQPNPLYQQYLNRRPGGGGQ